MLKMLKRVNTLKKVVGLDSFFKKVAVLKFNRGIKNCEYLCDNIAKWYYIINISALNICKLPDFPLFPYWSLVS